MNFSNFPVIKIPALDLTTDPLDLLLTSIALRMKQLSRSSPKFIELIYDRQFRIEIAAENGVSKHFIVDHGTISTDSGAGKTADFRLIFANTDYAVKTLLKADPSAFMSGVQDGQIKLEGDYSLLLWFTKTSKLLAPKLPKPVQQKYQQVRQLFSKKIGR